MFYTSAISIFLKVFLLSLWFCKCLGWLVLRSRWEADSRKTVFWRCLMLHSVGTWPRFSSQCRCSAHSLFFQHPHSSHIRIARAVSILVLKYFAICISNKQGRPYVLISNRTFLLKLLMWITHLAPAHTLIYARVHYNRGRIFIKNNWQDGFQRILSFMFDCSTKNVGVCEINI